jgi:hypothetical protein
MDILSLSLFEMGLSAVERAMTCVAPYSVKEDVLYERKGMCCH